MARRFVKPEDWKEISEVNVVPLADVSLVLLIILLLLSPMLNQSVLKVQVASGGPGPEASKTESKPKPETSPLLISIQPDGFYLGDKLYSNPSQLAYALIVELKGRNDKRVLVAPAGQILHGEVVRILDLVKQCGAGSVTLVKRG